MISSSDTGCSPPILIPRRPTTIFVDQVEKRTSGLQMVAMMIMGRATKHAAFSGMAMAIHFGASSPMMREK